MAWKLLDVELYYSGHFRGLRPIIYEPLNGALWAAMRWWKRWLRETAGAVEPLLNGIKLMHTVHIIHASSAISPSLPHNAVVHISWGTINRGRREGLGRVELSEMVDAQEDVCLDSLPLPLRFTSHSKLFPRRCRLLDSGFTMWWGEVSDWASALRWYCRIATAPHTIALLNVFMMHVCWRYDLLV